MSWVGASELGDAKKIGKAPLWLKHVITVETREGVFPLFVPYGVPKYYICTFLQCFANRSEVF